MIEGILQIGEALNKEDNMLNNQILNLQPIKKNKQLNVLKFDFKLKNNTLNIDIDEEMDKDTAKKYTFVGSADGPNSPQWYVSSVSSNYHLTETIYNLSKMNFGQELNSKIKQILKYYYVDLGEELKEKYRFVLNLYKFGITKKSMEQIYEEVKKEVKESKDIGKKLVDKIKKEFESYLAEELGIKSSDIGLYTLLIDGELLADLEEYKNAVVDSKKPKTKVKKSENTGVCSLCGSEENVTSDLSKMKIKYYTTNQLIFASNIDKKNYYKNMQMCAECFSKMLSGENYILNKLSTKLSAFDVYIIPQFIYGQPLSENELNLAADKMFKSFNTVKSFKSVEELRNSITGTLDLRDENSYFVLNFMFYKNNQQATKIQRLIKDVNPSIFIRLAESSLKSYEDFKSVLGSKYKGVINLATIYYMIPIRIKKGDAVQYRDVLQIYDAVLTGKKINSRHLIRNVVDCIKVIRLSKNSYNINPDSESIEFYTLKANMYIKFLKYLGCLEEEEGVDVSTLGIKDNIKKFIEKMKYNEQQAAMFLLGYLVGEIGNAQYKKNEEGQKPILNKINFNGIDKPKIIRLTKDVFNKLNQEKIRQYYEVTFFEMKKLLDGNLNDWKLNKDESLFYLLSGYSYATTLPMLREEKKDE